MSKQSEIVEQRETMNSIIRILEAYAHKHMGNEFSSEHVSRLIIATLVHFLFTESENDPHDSFGELGIHAIHSLVDCLSYIDPGFECRNINADDKSDHTVH